MGSYDTRGGTPRHDPMHDHDPADPLERLERLRRDVIAQQPIDSVRFIGGPAEQYLSALAAFAPKLLRLWRQARTLPDRMAAGAAKATDPDHAEWCRLAAKWIRRELSALDDLEKNDG